MKLTRDLREFIELLNAQSVDHLLIGGWAFGFHAQFRCAGKSTLEFLVQYETKGGSSRVV